jgi:hypothetical protein
MNAIYYKELNWNRLIESPEITRLLTIWTFGPAQILVHSIDAMFHVEQASPKAGQRIEN